MGGRARAGVDRARAGRGVSGTVDRHHRARGQRRPEPRGAPGTAEIAQRPDRRGPGDPAPPAADSLGLPCLLPPYRARPRHDPDAGGAADLRADLRRRLQGQESRGGRRDNRERGGAGRAACVGRRSAEGSGGTSPLRTGGVVRGACESALGRDDRGGGPEARAWDPVRPHGGGPGRAEGDRAGVVGRDRCAWRARHRARGGPLGGGQRATGIELLTARVHVRVTRESKRRLRFMPEDLLESTEFDEVLTAPQEDLLPPAPPEGLDTALYEHDERAARADLRRQIAAMELALARLFGSAFPRKRIEFTVPGMGGPRVLSVDELEQVRDGLAARIQQVKADLHEYAVVEESNRELIERMTADPGSYKWVRVYNDDIGEPGCKNWHAKPRWGPLGLLMGWWRVKISSGCPLAEGPRPPDAQQTAAT